VQGPVMRVERAHDLDVHCVDWNLLNPNLVVTGSADKTARFSTSARSGEGDTEGEVLDGPKGPPASGAGSSPGAGFKPPKSKAVYTFKGGHSEAITCVQVQPQSMGTSILGL